MRRTSWLSPVAAVCLLLMPQVPRAVADPEEEPPADPFAAFDLSRPPSPEGRASLLGRAAAPALDLEELFRPAWLPGDGARRKLSNKADGSLGSLTTQVVLTAPGVGWESPLPAEAWRTEQAWKLEVFGPLSVFGQLGAGLTPAATEEMKVNGRTGLACKLPVPALDVQLRGGPSVSCTDPQRAERTQAHSEMLVEVVARCPLWNGVGLEYQGSAAPALSPADRDHVDHDMRLALPLGRLGQLKLGAKHHWDGTATPHSWADGTQFYLSFGIGQ
jgi:hypothetical protein